MAAEHEGRHILYRDVELLGEEVAEARRIEHPGHADHALRRQARSLAQRPDHGVERVGYADDEGVRAVFADGAPHSLHDLAVGFQQVIAAHARLARHSRGDDGHVRALDAGVIGGPGKARVEALHRRGFGDVEALSLGDAVDDVEQRHVAELFEAGEMGERAADISGADERDPMTGHGSLPCRRRGAASRKPRAR